MASSEQFSGYCVIVIIDLTTTHRRFLYEKPRPPTNVNVGTSVFFIMDRIYDRTTLSEMSVIFRVIFFSVKKIIIGLPIPLYIIEKFILSLFYDCDRYESKQSFL
jgi:hypothetical protein